MCVDAGSKQKKYIAVKLWKGLLIQSSCPCTSQKTGDTITLGLFKL